MDRLQDSPAFTPPPGNPRFGAVSGLRGVIALGVLGCHTTSAIWHDGLQGALAFGLGLGIYAFFALSGFLLYRPYVRARAAGEPAPRVRDYFRRRVLRVVPGYWVALTLLAIWPGVPGVFGEHWYAYYGFLQIYSSDFLHGGLPQAWSLCVDASFYLALPVYAAVVGRIGRGGDWLLIEGGAVGVLIVGGFVIRAVGAAGGISPVVLSSLPGWIAFFALGMALAVVSVGMRTGEIGTRLSGALVRWAWPALAAAVVLFFVYAVAFGAPTSLGWNLPQIGAAATPLGDVSREMARQFTLFGLTLGFVLGPMLGAPRGLAHRLFTTRWLIGAGLFSYGLYLYHVSLLFWWSKYMGVNQIDFFGHPTLLTVLGTLVLSLPAAILSYRYIELPFLSRKEREATQPAGIRTKTPLPERSPA